MSATYSQVFVPIVGAVVLAVHNLFYLLLVLIPMDLAKLRDHLWPLLVTALEGNLVHFLKKRNKQKMVN